MYRLCSAHDLCYPSPGAQLPLARCTPTLKGGYPSLTVPALPLLPALLTRYLLPLTCGWGAMGKRKQRTCSVANYYNLELGCSLLRPKSTIHSCPMLDVRRRVLVCSGSRMVPLRVGTGRVQKPHLGTYSRRPSMAACTRVRDWLHCKRPSFSGSTKHAARGHRGPWPHQQPLLRRHRHSDDAHRLYID